jgi:glycosyltransferase involved in cell wall biosynthesis
MRIGVDARELSGEATGVGRYLQCLLREWGLSGAEHHWTLYSPDGRVAPPPGLAAEVALVRGPGNTLWEQGALARAVRNDRPDVFLAPGYTAPLTTGVPLVVAMHDVSFAAHPEWYRRREGLRRRWLARLAARQARAVITISEFSRGEIVRHLGITADRVHVIPLGVGLSGGAPQASERDPLVLFVGSIFNRRHLPALVDGFSRLATGRPEVRLEIVGANRTHPHVDVRALADAAVPGRIRIRDWVEDDELRSLYKRAAAFAFLSEYEGFGLTPLEALAAGIPPVVLDTAVAREVLGDAAIYVDRPDGQLVARALADAIGPGPDRSRVLRAASAVVARYDWRRTAAATLAVLEQAAQS